jgi:endonuclease/exonuclease/phosphatase family metal-dependent hydrolase
VDDLQAQLPTFAHTGCGRDDGRDAGEYAAIFYRKDVYTLKEEGTFWLSSTPEVPSIGWDAKFNRICTWVKLESIKTRGTLFVFNTHFDHQGTVARQESARLILGKIKEIAGEHPSVLTGDFNVDQSSESYKLIHDSSLLSDAFETAEERYALNGTPCGFTVASYTDRRIDHVFHTRGFKSIRYGVLTDSYRSSAEGVAETASTAFRGEMKFRNYQPRTPSDHFPVLVELE